MRDDSESGAAPAGHYERVALLGEGAMGRVYRAVHHPTGEVVAIKVLRNQSPELRRSLLDEASAAARIESPHVVPILDIGQEASGSPFLVMELVEGSTLASLFERWPGWPVVARIFDQVLEGLGAAHAVNVVHCDLKPSNVLIRDADHGVRIVDFGVAAIIDPLEQDGDAGIAGTPKYMAPEQLTHEGPLGPFTDLHSFGVMLAEAVRGAPPFKKAKSVEALIAEKRAYLPVADRRVREGLEVPERLQRLIDALLHPHPRHRARFARRVRAELAAIRDQVVDRTDGASRATPSTFPSAAPDGPSREHFMQLTLLPAPLDPRRDARVRALRRTKLVGRDGERRELLAMIDEVSTRGGAQLVAYVGEPGVGKSRLARFGLEEVERNGRMEGTAIGFDTSFAERGDGLLRILSRWLGKPLDPSVSWAWIADSDVDLERLRQWMTQTPDDTLERAGIGEVVDVLHRVIRSLSQRVPVYLWLDDLAWARDGSIELVARLLAAQDANVLLVATLRAGTMDHPLLSARLAPIFASPFARTRTVAPMDVLDRRALIASLAPLAPGLVDELSDRLEGSPLLIGELVRTLTSRDELRMSPAGLVLRRPHSVSALLHERALASLLEGRIDSFLGGLVTRAGLAEAVLVRAALLGASFDDATLRACLADEPELLSAVDEVLDGALLQGILRVDGPSRFAFDHGLHREALSARLERSPNARGVLRSVAAGLENRFGTADYDVAATVAVLLRRAGDRERAWERLCFAIDTAAWSGDLESARAHLARGADWMALDALPHDDIERARFAFVEARVHYFRLDYEAAYDALTRCREISTLARDWRWTLKCDAFSAELAFYTHRLAESERIASRCAQVEVGEDPWLADIAADVAHRLADLAALKGDEAGNLRQVARECRLRIKANEPERTRSAHASLAEAFIVTEQFDQAAFVLDVVRDEAIRARAGRWLDVHDEVRATLAHARGDFAGARPFVEERLRRFVARGDLWRATGLHALAAAISVEIDPDAEAIAAVRRFTSAYERVPHDEVTTMKWMRRMLARLNERGLRSAAEGLSRTIEARDARIARGFG